MSDRHLILTGFMGTGKSTLAVRVAEARQRPCYDLDAEIVRATGFTIADMFADNGEANFRVIERDVLRILLAQPPAIIATGGGTWCDAESRALLQASGAQIVCLTAAPEILWERVQRTTRPLAQSWEQFQALWQARQPLYQLIPLQIDTQAHTLDECVAQVLAQLA